MQCILNCTKLLRNLKVEFEIDRTILTYINDQSHPMQTVGTDCRIAPLFKIKYNGLKKIYPLHIEAQIEKYIIYMLHVVGTLIKPEPTQDIRERKKAKKTYVFLPL